MSAAETLAEAQAAGVRLGLEGTALLIESDREPPSHLLDALRRDKPEILAMLQTRDTGDVSPPATAIQSPNQHGLTLTANDAGGPDTGTSKPVADLARGRRLIDRLRWTGRRIGISPDGTLVVRPRIGTADPFGREVAAHPDDIAAVLAAETAGAVA